MDSMTRRRKFDAIKSAEASGDVADSMVIRLAIMARFHSGEITLEAAQSEIMAIKRNAKKSGKMTRNQAFCRG